MEEGSRVGAAEARRGWRTRWIRDGSLWLPGLRKFCLRTLDRRARGGTRLPRAEGWMVSCSLFLRGSLDVADVLHWRHRRCKGALYRSADIHSVQSLHASVDSLLPVTKKFDLRLIPPALPVPLAPLQEEHSSTVSSSPLSSGNWLTRLFAILRASFSRLASPFRGLPSRFILSSPPCPFQFFDRTQALDTASRCS